MRRLLLIGWAALLAAALTTNTFASGNEPREPEVLRLDDSNIIDYYAAVPPWFLVACNVGNLNAPAFAINNFLTPPESYAFSFDPSAQCAQCAQGFQVTVIHIILNVQAACTLVMGANLTELGPSGITGCEAPASQLCTASLYNVNLPAAGTYNIALPVTCQCAYINPYNYAVEVYFQSKACTNNVIPRLVTDNLPTLCSSWNDYGAGWGDLRADFPTWPGNLLIYAETTCCEDPISTHESSWGTIKALYGTKE